MSDYTPTTEQIRTEWALSNPKGSPTTIMHAEAAFDRWLAAHDAEVRAAALSEQGEEWEYGVRDVQVDGWVNVTRWQSPAQAKQDLATCGMNCGIVRRRTDDPDAKWLPVPTEETPNHTNGSER